MKNPSFERFWSDVVTDPEISSWRCSTLVLEDLKGMLQIFYEAGWRSGRVEVLAELNLRKENHAS